VDYTFELTDNVNVGTGHICGQNKNKLGKVRVSKKKKEFLCFVLAKSYLCTRIAKADMKEKIRTLLEEALPLVDFDSDFLFSELDSLGVTTILMLLSDEFGIKLESTDATPKNLKTLDSIVALVEQKLSKQ
jgi:acyl carrier protein